MDIAIETVGLVKEFNKGLRLPLSWVRKNGDGGIVHAVDGVSIAVARGTIYGLLGPNGAGKTTLSKMLCTLIVPTGGTAHVNGYDIQRDGAQVRASVGLVTSDERSFYWRLTGRENLLFFAALHNLSPQHARERTTVALAQTGMVEHADARFHTYSTGMKQRLALARGLLHDPPLLVLDEPTRGLDPLSAIRFRDLLTDDLVKKQGKTILLTTHQLDEAARLCDRLAIMDHGKICAEGTIPELTRLFTQTTRYHVRVAGLTPAQAQALCDGSVGLVEDETSEPIQFQVTSGNAGEELTRFIDGVVRAGGQVRDVEKSEMPLERLFERVLENA